MHREPCGLLGRHEPQMVVAMSGLGLAAWIHHVDLGGDLVQGPSQAVLTSASRSFA